jgi:hypothetical protein
VEKQVDEGQLEQALTHLEKQKLREGHRDYLLYLLAKASLQHYLGQYQASFATFDLADRKAQALKTKSISAGVLSYMANDLTQEYAGDPYEVVQIPLFMALNQLMLAEGASDSSEKLIYLDQALAMTKRMHHALETLKFDKPEHVMYRDDVAGRILFGLISEMQAQLSRSLGDTTEALQFEDLALKNYQQAKKTLGTYYAGYTSYNKGAKAARQYFANSQDLQGLGKTVDWFPEALTLDQFIRAQMDRIESYLNKSEGAQVHKRLVQEKGEVILFIEAGRVPSKHEDVISIGLHPVHNALIRSQGLPIPINPLRIKLPKYPDPLPAGPTAAWTLQNAAVSSSENVQGQAILLNDYGDIAVGTFNEESAARVVKTTFRASAKFAASYIAGLTVQQQTKSWIAGAFTELGAGLLADLSEQTDLRSWSLLPRRLMMVRIPLEPGIYDVQVQVRMRGKTERIRLSEPVTLLAGQKKIRIVSVIGF